MIVIAPEKRMLLSPSPDASVLPGSRPTSIEIHPRGGPDMEPGGNIAIITGAASSMGVATARMFAREGTKGVIADVV